MQFVCGLSSEVNVLMILRIGPFYCTISDNRQLAIGLCKLEDRVMEECGRMRDRYQASAVNMQQRNC